MLRHPRKCSAVPAPETILLPLCSTVRPVPATMANARTSALYYIRRRGGCPALDDGRGRETPLSIGWRPTIDVDEVDSTAHFLQAGQRPRCVRRTGWGSIPGSTDVAKSCILRLPAIFLMLNSASESRYTLVRTVTFIFFLFGVVPFLCILIQCLPLQFRFQNLFLSKFAYRIPLRLIFNVSFFMPSRCCPRAMP